MTDPGYSPFQFYTGSRDKKGHDSDIRTRIPPSVKEEIAAMVASRKIPEYRTPADFYRDAIYHRLRWLEEHHQVDTRAAKLYALQCEMEQRVETQKTAERLVTNLRQMYLFAKTAEQIADARDCALKAAEVLEEPWKSDILQSYI